MQPQLDLKEIAQLIGQKELVIFHLARECERLVNENQQLKEARRATSAGQAADAAHPAAAASE